jgi:hypothetical protein
MTSVDTLPTLIGQRIGDVMRLAMVTVDASTWDRTAR